MIVSISPAAVAHSTNPVAAALTAALRPASFQSAGRTEDAAYGSPAPLDIERLYPNLVGTAALHAPRNVVSDGVALVRRALAGAL